MSTAVMEPSVLEAALAALLAEHPAAPAGPRCTPSSDTGGDEVQLPSVPVQSVPESSTAVVAPRSGDPANVTPDLPGPLSVVATELARLGLPDDVVADLVAVVRCAAAHTRPDGPSLTGSRSLPPGTDRISHADLLDAARAVRGVQGFADAVSVQAGRTLAHRSGQELLSRIGVADPGELSRTRRDRWRAKAKSVTAQELAVATGWSVPECHARVGFSVAPAAATTAVEQALTMGRVQWRGVAAWWSRCRAMEVGDAGTVADAVFGPLLEECTPEDPSAEDVTAGADMRRESWGEFVRRLDREVVRVEGRDAAAARAARRASLDRRDVSTELCDDGTGSLTVSGPTSAVVGAADRIEAIARKARAAGDSRPLRHIRADTALALLVHGTVRFGTPHDGARRESAAARSGQGDDADLLVPWPTDVERIIRGLPTASVELHLPLSALNPSLAEAAIGCAPCDAPGGCDGPERLGPRPSRPTASRDSRDIRGGPGSAGGSATADVRDDRGQPGLDPAPSVEPRSRRSPVGELTGHGFVTPEHARELALLPGSVWHRVLYDPMTGRTVERSAPGYRPDQAMADQVAAVDGSCRAPGCLVPAARCDLDHEHPFGQGGTTSETNLNPKHRAHHALKTEGFWTSVMDATRTVTWRTLFGRVHRTRPPDRRHYEQGRDAAGDTEALPGWSADGCGRGSAEALPELDHLPEVDDPDLQDRLVYAALASRDGMDHWLEGFDDHEDHPDGWTSGVDRPLRIFHRHGSRRRAGPPPDGATVDQLLGRGRPPGLVGDRTGEAPSRPWQFEPGATPPF